MPLDIPQAVVPKLENYAGSPDFHDVVIRVISSINTVNDESNVSPDTFKRCKREIKPNLEDVPMESVFFGHKVVLASASEWFKNLFTSGMSESSKSEITIQETDPRVFEKLLRLIYSSNFVVENVFEALCISRIADRLQLNEICEQSFYYLENQITCENLWIIWEHAVLLECEDVQKFCKNYFRRNCIASLQSSAWLELDGSWATRTLEIDQLNSYVKEVIFYHAALNWRESKLDDLFNRPRFGNKSRLRSKKRLFHPLEKCREEEDIENWFSKMIHCIRFPQMEMDYLLNCVENNSVVMNVPGIKELASIQSSF
ncbi:hypothetical protein CLU79DRAFT_751585 [Phycomyces nitens]|nr:hypothetical protein CLU79DRAFT_751585 [Phycomyces nitens]